MKLGQFAHQQHAVMRECHLAGARHAAAAGHRRGTRGVVQAVRYGLAWISLPPGGATRPCCRRASPQWLRPMPGAGGWLATAAPASSCLTSRPDHQDGVDETPRFAGIRRVAEIGNQDGQRSIASATSSNTGRCERSLDFLVSPVCTDFRGSPAIKKRTQAKLHLRRKVAPKPFHSRFSKSSKVPSNEKCAVTSQRLPVHAVHHRCPSNEFPGSGVIPSVSMSFWFRAPRITASTLGFTIVQSVLSTHAFASS